MLSFIVILRIFLVDKVLLYGKKYREAAEILEIDFWFGPANQTDPKIEGLHFLHSAAGDAREAEH